MTNQPRASLSLDQPATYQIRVPGELDAQGWPLLSVTRAECNSAQD